MYIHSTTTLHYNSREKNKGGGETVGEWWLRTLGLCLWREKREISGIVNPSKVGDESFIHTFHIRRAFIVYRTRVRYDVLFDRADRNRRKRRTLVRVPLWLFWTPRRKIERLWLITLDSLALIGSAPYFSWIVCAGWFCSVYTRRAEDKGLRRLMDDSEQRNGRWQ
jgi:hypothetical protein